MNKNPAQNRNHDYRTSSGFTLIELLIVVSILGLLAALSLSVINVDRQRKVTEDAVRRSNMEKLAQSFESFCAAEGRCATAAEAATPTVVPVSTYIKTWPVGRNGDLYTYTAFPAATPTKFQVSVLKAIGGVNYIIYNSDWAKIMECTVVPPILGSGATATTGCTSL